MECEGCTSTNLKNIPADVVDKLLFKQLEMKPKLGRKPTLPQVIMRVLKDWAGVDIEKAT